MMTDPSPMPLKEAEVSPPRQNVIEERRTNSEMGMEPSILREITKWSLLPFFFFVLILCLHDILPDKPGLVFEPRFFIFFVNLVFIFLSSLAVTYFSGRAYLKSGTLSLLLLGSGALAMGLSNAIGSLLLKPGSENLAVSVHNCGVLLAGALHFSGTVLASSEIRIKKKRNRGSILLLAYVGVMLFILYLSLFSEDTLPRFFVQSTGFTHTRQLVLNAAVILFLVSGFSLTAIYYRTRARSQYWYSLALVLFAIGLLGVFLQRAVGDPIGWTGRSAQCLAGVFLFISALRAFKTASLRQTNLDEFLSSIFSKSPDLYSALIKTTSDAVIVIDGKERVRLWNSAAQDMFGYTEDELGDKSLFDLLLSQDLRSVLTKSIRGSSDSRLAQPMKPIEFIATRKNGETFSAEASLSVSKLSFEPFGTLIIRDITPRKLAEEALRRSEARRQIAEAVEAERRRLYDVLETLPAMICLLTKDYHVAFANRAFREKFGESLGRHCYEYCFGQDEPCAFCETYKVLETGKPHRYEVTGPNGGVIDAYDFPFADVDGSPMILEMDIDITDRKRAEAALRDLNETLEKRVAKRTSELRKSRDELDLRVKERTAELKTANTNLRRANRRLEELNKELQDFAFVASHDLNEPLRKIRAFGDMLAKSETSLNKTSRDYIARMQTAAERMQNLLNSLLSYSRVTTKAEPMEETDLGESVQETLSNLEILINEKNARVEVGNLPAVKADPVQMIQLFQNLIQNALKFHRDGDAPHVRIYARTGKDNKSHEICVEDNGIGFEEQYLEKIFLPFQRLHGRSSEYEGVGMGLAICKKIAGRHGGDITAKSELGIGSTFIVTLPVNKEA